MPRVKQFKIAEEKTPGNIRVFIRYPTQPAWAFYASGPEKKVLAQIRLSLSISAQTWADSVIDVRLPT